MAEGSRMWVISLLTILFLFPLLSAAPLDIAGDIKKEDVKTDNDGMHSHDENVTREGKFFGHNRFDLGDMNISGSVAGDVVSIGHKVKIDVHGHTHDHHHHEADTGISTAETNKNIRAIEDFLATIQTIEDELNFFSDGRGNPATNNLSGDEVITRLINFFSEDESNIFGHEKKLFEIITRAIMHFYRVWHTEFRNPDFQAIMLFYRIWNTHFKSTYDDFKIAGALRSSRSSLQPSFAEIKSKLDAHEQATTNCRTGNCDAEKIEAITKASKFHHDNIKKTGRVSSVFQQSFPILKKTVDSVAEKALVAEKAKLAKISGESCTNKLVPGMSSVYLGYDMVRGDPTAEGIDDGYMSAIFDEDFECKNNYVNSKPHYDLKCDKSFYSELYFESEHYSKTVFSEKSYGYSIKSGSDVEVEATLGVPDTASVSVKKNIPNHIKVSASNTQAMRSNINALDSSFLTMAKSDATCYHYSVKILEDQHPRFTDNFKRAVRNYEDCMISSHQNTEKKAECAKSFFNNYGTHYIEEADIGASMTYTKFYQNDKTSGMSSQSKEECSSKEAELAIMVTANGYKKSCQGDKSSKSKIEAFQVKQSRLITRGSTPAKNWFDWAKQSDDIVIIRKLIKPLSNLFTSSYFEDDDVKDLAKTQLWLAQDIVDYCEIFRKERRCNFATDWKFTIPSTCKHHPYLQGTWTGPLNENLLPHGEGIFEKYPTKLKFFYNGCPRKDLLPSGGMMVAGDKLTSPHGEYTTLMREDGNLVLYDANNKVWWTTQSENYVGAFLKFDSNGNLALYDGAGNKTIWNSQTEDNDADRLVMQTTNGNLVLYTKDGTILWKALRDVLLPGGKLIEGDQLTSQDGNYKVFLQRDGDLVIKRSNGFLWWSVATNGGPHATTPPGSGSYFQFQRSGNLEVINKEGIAVWDSSTGGHYDAEQLKIHNNGALVLYAGSKLIWQSQRDVLKKGEKLWAGQSLRSPDLAFEFAVQRDGNMVVYQIFSKNRIAKKASGTDASGAGTALVFQWDGNLVLTKAGNVPSWDSDTDGSGADNLVMQNDGNLVLYTANRKAVWSSNDGF